MRSPSLQPGVNVDLLLDHIESPYHKGTLEQASTAGRIRNRSCGDEITLQLLIVDHRIDAAWFTGRGCALSSASASILCEWVEGKCVVEVEQLDADQFLAMLGTTISPGRQRCVLLSQQLLIKLLTEKED